MRLGCVSEQCQVAIGTNTRPTLLPPQVAKLPSWRSTLTLRALLIGALLGACFCIISLKLGLTTGGAAAGGPAALRCATLCCAMLRCLLLASLLPPPLQHLSDPSCRPCHACPPTPHPLVPPTSARAATHPAVIPSLNIAAGLLGFFFLKGVAKGADWAKLPVKLNPPLSAQEVTVIQVRPLLRTGFFRRVPVAAWFGRWVVASLPGWGALARHPLRRRAVLRPLGARTRAGHAPWEAVHRTPCPADHVRGVLRPGLQRRLWHLHHCNGLPVLSERGAGCAGQPATGKGARGAAGAQAGAWHAATGRRMLGGSRPGLLSSAGPRTGVSMWLALALQHTASTHISSPHRTSCRTTETTTPRGPPPPPPLHRTWWSRSWATSCSTRSASPSLVRG